MYKIPLMKNAFLQEEVTKNALADFILNTNRLSMGEKCESFEYNFAQTQGSNHAILFNSGGSANLALIQALKNLGQLQNGDKVAFSALTWSTNTMPIIQLGLIPVALDCEKDTMNVSSNKLLERLETTSIKALFITNVLGFTADIDEVRKICIEKDIILIEDNCESLGTELKEGKTGNFGIASTFSFYVAHHMSTIEGGMICTRDEELADMLKVVRANGWDRNLSPEKQQNWRAKYGLSDFIAKYSFYDLGYNLRPTEITGFLGNFQLQFLDETISLRERNYLQIEKAIKSNTNLIALNHDHIKRLSTFAIPVICNTPELRNHLVEKFESNGIETRPIIAGNMQTQPFYDKYVETKYSMPNTEFLHANGFYCGNYPELTNEDIDLIKLCLK